MENRVTDIAIFKLKDGEAKNRTLFIGEWDKFLKKNEGFISRQLLQSDSQADRLIDIIVWESADHGNKAFHQMQRNPHFAKINAVIDSMVLTERCIQFKA